MYIYRKIDKISTPTPESFNSNSNSNSGSFNSNSNSGKSLEYQLQLQLREFQLQLHIARPPHQPPVILSSTPELGLTPLTCVCWQINSILANIGHRNSIRILNQYPFWWNILIWA